MKKGDKIIGTIHTGAYGAVERKLMTIAGFTSGLGEGNTKKIVAVSKTQGFFGGETEQEHILSLDEVTILDETLEE